MLLEARARVGDWRSYDSIAEGYHRLWGRRFEAAAAHLLAFAPPSPGSRLLDLGTGSGAVASALGDRLEVLAVVGCDLSRPMLARARRRMPALRTVLADATGLPFRQGCFDLVTGNCVLSHVLDFRQALAETLRVLSRPGRLALSSWGPASDPYDAAWEELLAVAVGKDALARAIEAVTPWSSRFSRVESLRADLLEAGFDRVSTETVETNVRCRVYEYLAERQLQEHEAPLRHRPRDGRAEAPLFRFRPPRAGHAPEAPSAGESAGGGATPIPAYVDGARSLSGLRSPGAPVHSKSEGTLFIADRAPPVGRDA